jgi:hypothetical protein
MSILSEKDLNIINKMKGQIIGSSLKEDRGFVIKKVGREEMGKVEKKMAELGYPLKYEEIENYHWYSAQMDALFLLISKRIFDWDKDQMWEWGRWAAKVHFVTKMMLRYFVSKEILVKSANKNWKKYYTEGKLSFSFEGKKGKIELKDFVLHPEHVGYLAGYFYQIASLVMPPENLKLKVSETGKLDYHLFELTW